MTVRSLPKPLHRREFLLGAALPMVAAGAVKFGEEVREGDTAILLFPATDYEDGPFAVGVRSSFEGEADHIWVEVCYSATVSIEGKPTPLTLVKGSLAPFAGNNAYGATTENFDIPRYRVERIVVTFLKFLVAREFK